MNKPAASNLLRSFFHSCYEAFALCSSERSRFSTSTCQENVTCGEQGYQTLEKQHQNGREGAQNGDLVGSASVNCEDYIPVVALASV